jgi:hypothetical protein
MAEYKRVRVKSVSGVPMPLFGKSQPQLSSDPYDGVLREVQNFMDAVSNGIRGIKFGYLHSANKVAVYMEGHPYTMGWIGFFDHRDNPSEEIPHYIVYSNNINNGKYAWSDQVHMATSVNLSTAVKNAKKYLRNFTINQLAYDEFFSISTEHTDIGYQASQKTRIAKSKLNDHDSFYSEMSNILAMGHQFINIDFANSVQEYVTLEQEQKQSRKSSAVFVRHYERLGKNVFDVVDIPDVTKDRLKVLHRCNQTYTEEDLPKHIMDGIAVLRILPETAKDTRSTIRGTYVDGVGHRVGDDMYFILV